MKPHELVKIAAGRSIVLGESHYNRMEAHVTLELLRCAHCAGYRLLGCERCDNDFSGHPGLQQFLSCVRFLKDIGCIPHEALSARDNLAVGRAQLLQVLFFGWEVISIDPNFSNWFENTRRGYFLSRDPTMAQCIQEYPPMVAIVGALHLKGISDILGDTVVYTSVCCVRPRERERHYALAGKKRVDFIETVPRLTL